MKKMMYFLKKKKKVVEISSSITTDAVPEPPRNIPHYNSKPTQLYKNFQPNCCVDEISECNSVSNNVQNEITEETIQLNGCGENFCEAQPLEVEVLRSDENNLTTNVEQCPVVCLTPESGTISTLESDNLNSTNDLNNKSGENLSRNNPMDNATMGELSQGIQKLSTDLTEKGINGDKKTNGNTYVITISNSTHFHIGSQKTVNYPGADNKINEKSQLQFTDIRNKKLLTLNDSQAIDIKDVVSEDDMLRISLSVRERWKDFARNLGAKESTIRELEDLNDKDYNLVVYDILRQYLNKYPNTSVGFMIDILKKSNEMEAVEKLLENR